MYSHTVSALGSLNIGSSYVAQLKEGPLKPRGHPHCYVNEDLTRQRSAPLFNVRKLKRDRIIQDAWSSVGNILVKDNSGRIHHVHRLDHSVFSFCKLNSSYPAVPRWLYRIGLAYRLVQYGSHLGTCPNKFRYCTVNCIITYKYQIPNSQVARCLVLTGYSLFYNLNS